MERTAPDEAATSPGLNGVPRQRPGREHTGAVPEAVPVLAVPDAASLAAVPDDRPVVVAVPDGASVGAGRSGVRAVLRGARRWGPRLSRLLPTPAATPFTFVYGAVLVLTSLAARYASPAVMDAVYRSSSTDVAHLVKTPVPVLAGSALWIAGGIASPYSLCFLLVLTGLERRAGTLRAAGVFLAGHVLATLATEVPVGLAVLAGDLPDSSLHRLDYGISFGVAASLGALAGLLRPWPRWILLAGFAGAALSDLLTFADPMTSAGHLVAVTLGVASWPVVRGRRGGGADG
ncbi:rhomboid-like protein [Streptomyces seoulensis]